MIGLVGCEEKVLLFYPVMYRTWMSHACQIKQGFRRLIVYFLSHRLRLKAEG